MTTAFTPKAMKAYDQVIKTANEEAAKAIAAELAGTPIKLVPVDLYSAIEQHDSKHYGDSRAIEVKTLPDRIEFYRTSPPATALPYVDDVALDAFVPWPNRASLILLT